MNKLRSEFSSLHRLFLSVFLTAIAAVLFAIWTKGLLAGTLLTVLVVSIFWITRPMWSPEYGKTLIRRISLGLILSTAGTYTLWSPIINAYIPQLLLKLFPSFSNMVFPEIQPSILVFVFILTGIFIVNYLMRDKTTMSKHPDPIHRYFPERDYPDELKALCSML